MLCWCFLFSGLLNGCFVFCWCSIVYCVGVSCVCYCVLVCIILNWCIGVVGVVGVGLL